MIRRYNTSRCNWLLAAAFVTIVFCRPMNGAASLTVPAGPFSDTRAACTDLTGTKAFTNCTSTAFISNVLATPNSTFTSPGTFNGTKPTTQTFQDAFNKWNTDQGANFGGNWKLIIANTALDIKITVANGNFAAQATSAKVGGISIVQADLSNYNPGANDPTAAQLVWSQALYINYQPPNTVGIEPPLNTMDTFSFSGGPTNIDPTAPDGKGPFGQACTAIPGPPNAKGNTTPSDIPNNITQNTNAANAQKAYCDPIYPFQGANQNAGGTALADKGFFDAPKGPWSPAASFRGIALLSTVTFKTDAITGAITERDLTVYNNGINYGFDLTTTPEPTYIILLSIASSLLVIVHRRRGRITT